ncbi:MAG: TMEM165/GDT1 family protein [Gammaproteobacteria bacterium]|nr:TMEM165/GDT1 family protein [Gammaproteobacteria bacterium]
MDLKLFATVFGIVFLAELGDKTQLATLLFASRSPGNLITVFVGASAALIVASAIGVVAGGVISQYVSPKHLSYVAGAGFVLIGAWTIWQGANLN